MITTFKSSYCCRIKVPHKVSVYINSINLKLTPPIVLSIFYLLVFLAIPYQKNFSFECEIKKESISYNSKTINLNLANKENYILVLNTYNCFNSIFSLYQHCVFVYNLLDKLIVHNIIYSYDFYYIFI